MEQDERPVFALCLRLLSALLFSTMFMLVKSAGQRDIALPEIMFWRQAVSLPVLVVWLGMANRLYLLKTKQPTKHANRAVIGTIGMVCGFAAVTLLPLAEATTLGFTAPLFAVLITALVIHDHVGPWRWSAVLLGFAGVLIITQPGSGEISALGLAAGLGSALVVAIVSFQIRSLARTDSPFAVVFYFALVGTLLMAPFLPFVMKIHDAGEWAILIGMGLAGTFGQVLASYSLRHGAVATVIIMDYTSLLWATMYGFFVFDRLPPYATWLGAPVIIGAGVIVLWREHYLARVVPPVSTQEVD